jgi:hypothetical protein
MIYDQLQFLFLIIKGFEGNVNMQEDHCKVLYNIL